MALFVTSILFHPHPLERYRPGEFLIVNNVSHRRNYPRQAARARRQERIRGLLLLPVRIFGTLTLYWFLTTPSLLNISELCQIYLAAFRVTFNLLELFSCGIFFVFSDLFRTIAYICFVIISYVLLIIVLITALIISAVGLILLILFYLGHTIYPIWAVHYPTTVLTSWVLQSVTCFTLVYYGFYVMFVYRASFFLTLLPVSWYAIERGICSWCSKMHFFGPDRVRWAIASILKVTLMVVKVIKCLGLAGLLLSTVLAFWPLRDFLDHWIYHEVQCLVVTYTPPIEEVVYGPWPYNLYYSDPTDSF
jgi:hypothetical protein